MFRLVDISIIFTVWRWSVMSYPEDCGLVPKFVRLIRQLGGKGDSSLMQKSVSVLG